MVWWRKVCMALLPQHCLEMRTGAERPRPAPLIVYRLIVCRLIKLWCLNSYFPTSNIKWPTNSREWAFRRCFRTMSSSSQSGPVPASPASHIPKYQCPSSWELSFDSGFTSIVDLSRAFVSMGRNKQNARAWKTRHWKRKCLALMVDGFCHILAWAQGDAPNSVDQSQSPIHIKQRKYGVHISSFKVLIIIAGFVISHSGKLANFAGFYKATNIKFQEAKLGLGERHTWWTSHVKPPRQMSVSAFVWRLNCRSSPRHSKVSYDIELGSQDSTDPICRS